MSDAKVNREPLTYSPTARVSYFRDLSLARNGDGGAEQRLNRHAAEMREEMPARIAEQQARARAAGVEFEQRAAPSTTDGAGGYFSPPLWLIDQFATAPRPSRVLADAIPSLPLPPGASTVNLPRITTGTATGAEVDGSAVASQDVIDAAATQPVTPIAGQSAVALQLLEQSPPGPHLDWAIFRDLTNSYDATLEALIVNGAGTGQTFAGILNLPTGAGAVTAVSYTDATPTAAELAPVLAQAVAQLADKRGAAPELIAMRTARWVWIAVSDNNLMAGGIKLMGFPVELDDSIPANLGAAANQDAIIAMVASDSLLLESPHQTSVMLEPLSGVLMARLRLHGYASCLHRQPTGIATVTGTGLIVQSGF
jgi:HK97 family phage major capsid protein